MLTEIEFEAELNIKSLDRILLVKMMQENEERIRENKIRIRSAYIDTKNNQQINNQYNQYGVSCDDVVTTITLENVVLIKRVNKIKLLIQSLKKENKIYNKNKSKKEYYLSAFIAAAELLLDKEEFIVIENKALQLMQVKS